MTNNEIPSIQPQTARLGCATTLRAFADRIEAGEVMFASCLIFYSTETTKRVGHSHENSYPAETRGDDD